jgi:hypothetical protein
VAIFARGMVDQVRDPQLPILHSSQHHSLHIRLDS